MQFSALLSSVIFPLLVGSSFLDIDELNNIHYAITIGDEPIKEDAITSPEHVTMVNKLGQKYRCQLPKLKEADSPDSDDEGVVSHDVATLLSPLQDLPCLFKTKDWWTYEFCYGRHIKQYHLENDKPVGKVIMLGVAQLVEEEVNQQHRYYPQWFNNGSRCDLTGRPRKTEVRFVCDETAQREIIGEILEPQSCEYTMVIHTNRICSVAWLRPPADAVPLPINCNPMLTPEQLDKFTRYQEVKARQALAIKTKREEDQRASLIKQLDGEDLAKIDVDSAAGLDVLQSMVGEKVADKLVGELNLLLDSALKQQGGGGAIKVLDLRGNNEAGKENILNSLFKNKKSEEEGKEKEKEGKWDLVHGGHKNYFKSDPTVQKHLRERNTLWRKIHETKKRIAKLKGQIQDHTLMIKNNGDSSKEALASYETRKAQLEEQLVVAKESLVMLEDATRDVSHRLVHAQQESRKNMVKERLDEIRKLMQSGTAKPTDYHAVLAKLKRDYKSMTGKTLIYMSEWFELVEKDVQDQDLDKIRKFMKFADGELPIVTEVSVPEANVDDIEQDDDDDDDDNDIEIFDKKIDSLSGKEKQRLGKIRNVLKDDLKDQFAEILREVKDDLDLEEADLDREVAMDKLAETLDDLMGKLSGAEEKIDRVHKHVEKVKKMVDTVNQEDNGEDAVHVEGILSPDKFLQKEGAKHDGKKSVKKELNDEIFEDILSDVESDEKDSQYLQDTEDKKILSSELGSDDEKLRFEKAHEQLMEVEKKLADLNKDLEYETKQLQKLTTSKLTNDAKSSLDVPDESKRGPDTVDIPNKVEVKITKVNANPKYTNGPLSPMTSQDDKIVKKLESSIKDKLEKFGMETGGKIEVKLITTTLPIGDVDDINGLGMDGEEAQQYQNMVYNLLTGNQAGYDDIDSQRKAEKNYKFNWDDSMLNKMTEKLGDTADEIYVSPEDIDGANNVIADLVDNAIEDDTLDESTNGEILVSGAAEEYLENIGDEHHDEL